MIIDFRCKEKVGKGKFSSLRIVSVIRGRGGGLYKSQVCKDKITTRVKVAIKLTGIRI